jgi:hypothetical protein
LNRVFSEYFGSPLSVSFYQYTILIFIYMLLLPEGQTVEAWEPKSSAVQKSGSTGFKIRPNFLLLIRLEVATEARD